MALLARPFRCCMRCCTRYSCASAPASGLRSTSVEGVPMAGGVPSNCAASLAASMSTVASSTCLLVAPGCGLRCREERHERRAAAHARMSAAAGGARQQPRSAPALCGLTAWAGAAWRRGSACRARAARRRPARHAAPAASCAQPRARAPGMSGQRAGGRGGCIVGWARAGGVVLCSQRKEARQQMAAVRSRLVSMRAA